MIKLYTLSLFLLSFCFSRAQYAGYTLLEHPETFKKIFAEQTAATGSIQSEFKQEKTLTMLSEKMVSSGKFWYQKPDRLRMEYIQPYAYLLVLKAGKMYIKEGQKENKLSGGSNRFIRQVNRILIDCVSGNMLNNPDFESRVFESSGSYLIELKPAAKSLAALYKNINIVVDKKDYSGKTIEMVELSGDITLIRFQNKILNAQIPDSVFYIP